MPKKTRKANPVPPSSRARAKLALRDSERRDFDRAAALYADFTGHEAGPLVRVKMPPTPRVAFIVGTCDGVLYTTVRDGKREKYIHQFRAKDKPLLCVDPDGEQLILVGGAYQFTERGIVDDSDPSR